MNSDVKTYPSSSVTTILVALVFISVFLLLWFMNKNAVLDDEVIAVKTQSEELNKEIAALRAEIVSIKSELDLTLAVNALDFTHTEMEASPTKAPADSIEQTVITEMPMVPAEVREAPVLSSDSPNVERLMDP